MSSDPLRQALEAARLADPDDVGTHSAYADYLQERGDPRGEFIQVQLALEDESKPAAQRKKLAEREAALLAALDRVPGKVVGPSPALEFEECLGILDTRDSQLLQHRPVHLPGPRSRNPFLPRLQPRYTQRCQAT